jgi:CheY-like chemotaxis protein
MLEEKLTLVLAEDNPGDVFLVRRALDAEPISYELLIAKDGEEAIRYVAEAEAGERTIHLFLIDLNLPRRDGLEVLARLRASSRLARVPVVLMTSSDSPRDRERGMALGASRYFQKPSDLKRFLEIGKIVTELVTAAPTK